METPAPPRFVDDARVVKYALVTKDVRPTGATRHYVGEGLMGPAAALAIAQYDGDSSYYLFYLDENAEAITDTIHDSISRALDQAAFEYEGLNWTDVSPG